jgi:ribose 5-phosphate isomerase A
MTISQQIESFKEAAAEAAVAQLVDGMVVGLGSGSTAELAVAAIGRRIKDGLRITGIPTSEKTAKQAGLLNIPLATLEEYPSVDLAIDGADEVEAGTLNLIKGGGGNLLREKLVALASSRTIIVVDERKLVVQLGGLSSLPVDVVPFGWKTTARRLDQLGGRPTLRLNVQGEAFLTDGGHYVLDCAFGAIHAPRALQEKLDRVVGVIEHGLFLGIATQVLVGGVGGVKTLREEVIS